MIFAKRSNNWNNPADAIESFAELLRFVAREVGQQHVDDDQRYRHGDHDPPQLDLANRIPKCTWVFSYFAHDDARVFQFQFIVDCTVNCDGHPDCSCNDRRVPVLRPPRIDFFGFNLAAVFRCHTRMIDTDSDMRSSRIATKNGRIDCNTTKVRGLRKQKIQLLSS